MQLRCETIKAQFPSDKTAARMVAEHDVIFDLTDEKGEKVHGTSEKAVYSSVITGNATNNLIELTGNPVLQTTNGTIQNAIIILDLAKHTLLTPGQFKIRGGPSTASTNRLVLPKLQPRAREGGTK